MASAWIEHVKKVAKQKKISYKEAMSVAKASYKGASAKASTKAKPKAKAKAKKEKKEME